MKKVRTGSTVSMRDNEKRAAQSLAELQRTLMPEHASEVIGINVDTGEYVLAPNDGGVAGSESATALTLPCTDQISGPSQTPTLPPATG